MNHAELSRDLALAIGYYPESVRIDTDKQGKYEPACRVYRISYDMGPYWRWFDYRHPDVAMPLLVWLMREHGCFADGPRFTIESADHPWVISADTPEEAIARAVIAVGGK